jgi:hypothetical protein
MGNPEPILQVPRKVGVAAGSTEVAEIQGKFKVEISHNAAFRGQRNRSHRPVLILSEFTNAFLA